MVSDFDLLIVGGGINGAGIARDAAGRGLRVMLIEQDDLANHTSSASTKLIHGGLRYLEHYEFRLVREALQERDRLLGIAPHIIWPLDFVMPMGAGSRPRWMIRLGLFLYDHLGGRSRLPKSHAVRLDGVRWGAGLAPELAHGFRYADCWVEDSRLVVLNVLDAHERGAEILTRTRFINADRTGDRWRATIRDQLDGAERTVTTRAIVNAAGPWVGDVLGAIDRTGAARPPRLIKGSHIIVPRRFAGDHAYIFQNPDKRIVFAIPYERDFTLIGTTDVPFAGDPARPCISAEETAYLCESVNRYLAAPVAPEDVVHAYSGVRPLYDDGEASASAVTRDYVLELGEKDAPQTLSCFGGKITTYRRLAEHALDKLAPFLPPMRAAWTASAPLPGGDFEDFDALLASIEARWPFLEHRTAHRLARAYGTRIDRVIGPARSLDDLGEDLGAGLRTREVDYLVAHEWALTAHDILWGRSKLQLHAPAETAQRLADYLARAALAEHAS